MIIPFDEINRPSYSKYYLKGPEGSKNFDISILPNRCILTMV